MRPPGRVLWRPSRRAVALALAGAAVLSCSLLTTFDDGLLREDTFERCRDRVDNDGDALVDCDDPDCAPFSLCGELTASACADGLDNDHDGLVDCDDPGCQALPGVCVEQTPAACSDSVDNDGDALVDCNDPDCQALDLCQEKSDLQCRDGLDNDQDGLVDCADFDCYSSPSCCTGAPVQFQGDDFTFAASCSVHSCTATEPTCCVAGYERCNSFDPARWVAWGLPRARQVDGAFVANDPCTCGGALTESSGVVSVESVRLTPGLRLRFTLDLAGAEGSVCAGLTRSTSFSDTEQLCSGAGQPRLLLGLCLARSAGARSVMAIVDGASQDERPLLAEGPIAARLELKESGVELTAGTFISRTAPLDPGLRQALVLLTGRGAGARLRQLVIEDPAAGQPRCDDPTAWYRHLGRGAPVVAAAGSLRAAEQPAVIARGSGLQLFFVGTSLSAGKSGLYSASSDDGVVWSVSGAPAIPASDARFGSVLSHPALLRRDGVLHLFYSRTDVAGGISQRAIGHATSADDGQSWTPAPAVLTPASPPAWDSLAVSAPSVLEAPDGALLMFYTGAPLAISPRPAIGVARSEDGGATWQRLLTAPVVAPAPIGQDLSCEEPAVAWDASRRLYRMWYTYRAIGEPAALRYAVSPDGQHWSVFPKGEALPTGPLGTFDERGVQAAAVILSDRVRLWYTGVNSKGTAQIGYAENRGSP